MNYSEYRAEAIKTMNNNLTKQEKLDYCLLKLMEETGELIGSYAKQIYHKANGNDIEELGDICWYVANIDSIIPNQQINTEFEREVILDDDEVSVRKTLKHRKELLKLSTRDDLVFGQMPTLVREIMDIVALLGLNIKDIFEANITKLRQRHGKEYNAKHYTASNS